MSLALMVTRLALIEQRSVSSNKATRSPRLLPANRTALKPQVSFEVLSYFTYQTLERQLAQKQLSRLLVASQSNCAGPVAVGFLHNSGNGWKQLCWRTVSLKQASPPVNLRAACLVRVMKNTVSTTTYEVITLSFINLYKHKNLWKCHLVITNVKRSSTFQINALEPQALDYIKYQTLVRQLAQIK